MAHVRSSAVLALSLLQLCHTEISSTEWYSANVINDGNLSPKPLIEIFSTDASFSTKKPVVVLQSTEPRTGDPAASIPTLPQLFNTNTWASNESVIPLRENVALLQPRIIQTNTTQPLQTAELPARIETPQQPIGQNQSQPQSTPIQPVPLQPIRFVQTLPVLPTQQTQPPPSQTTSTQTTTSANPAPVAQTIQPTLPTQQTQPLGSQSPSSSTVLSNISNPITQSQPTLPIYQFILPAQQPQPPLPQNISNQTIPSTNFTSSMAVAQFQPSNQAILPIQPLIVSVPVQFQPQTILPQPEQGQPRPIQVQPSTTTDSRAQSTTTQPNYSVVYQTSQPVRTPNVPINPVPVQITSNVPCNSPISANSVSPNVRPLALQASGYPVLKLRVVSPRGTITNVNINPNYPIATGRPDATRRVSTTVRPSTSMTRKSRRRNYDDCITACTGGRDPICASPAGVTPLNPDTLRGFPSICHMACHNAYRRNAYEKVVDGRCGRFRTRIRPVGAANKLNRDELNKAQYSVVETGGRNTLVQFAPLVTLSSKK